MPLSVLNVAFPFSEVGPGSVGGAEQIVHRLDLELARRGHRSLLLACEGSRAAGELITVPSPPDLITDEQRARVRREYRRLIGETLARETLDLVHFHGIDFDSYLPETRTPLLATLHLPPQWYSPRVFVMEASPLFLHCVSRTQQATAPRGARLLPPIENGVEIPSLPCRPLADRGYLACLGRICPEKGFHLALDAARELDAPLLLAGRVHPYREHEDYFRDEISPRLDGKRRFVGAVGPRGRATLLAGARCLLVPSLVAETSSLVAMEALASGTPVVAFPSGALSEIVEHERTGFLVANAREMATAIRRAERIDPAECRWAARQRFSIEAMLGSYLTLYERLAEQGRAGCVARVS